MSRDELIGLVICGMVATSAWSAWLIDCLRVRPFRSSAADRRLMALTPGLAGLALFLALKFFASHDVRDSSLYLAFYMVMGAAWTGIVTWLMPLLGLSMRDDVLERNNPAAAAAVAGAVIGGTLAFAGGNIGDGPGWWVVVFSALLSTGTLLLGWFIFDAFTRIADSVTIDRDAASGLRAAGFFVGSGLILGRAVAGDWVSVDATLADFAVRAWPVLPLWTAVFLLEMVLRPTPERIQRRPSGTDLFMFILYVGLGFLGAVLQGPW